MFGTRIASFAHRDTTQKGTGDGAFAFSQTMYSSRVVRDRSISLDAWQSSTGMCTTATLRRPRSWKTGTCGPYRFTSTGTTRPARGQWSKMVVAQVSVQTSIFRYHPD